MVSHLEPAPQFNGSIAELRGTIAHSVDEDRAARVRVNGSEADEQVTLPRRRQRLLRVSSERPSRHPDRPFAVLVPAGDEKHDRREYRLRLIGRACKHHASLRVERRRIDQNARAEKTRGTPCIRQRSDLVPRALCRDASSLVPGQRHDRQHRVRAAGVWKD